jgi:hypothetical protein
MEEENHYQKPAKLGKEDLVRLQALFSGDEKFQSKKQVELQRLLKSPVITQVLIKFKLWNDDEVTAIFSPREKHYDLWTVVEPVLRREFGGEIAVKFYLFVTPPVRKLADDKFCNQTLEELGLGAKACIRVGLPDELLGNVQFMKK